MKPDIGKKVNNYAQKVDIRDAILTILKKTYPHARIALQYANTWELLVAVMLSAQCTDAIVNRVTALLFVKYPRFVDYLYTNIYVFENDIKQVGFFRIKAKHILRTAAIIHMKYNDIVPNTMDELLTLPGVARKTANIVLANAYNTVVGIPVDTHVKRISQRLRLVNLEAIGGNSVVTVIKAGNKIIDYKKDADSQKIEMQLMENTRHSDWFGLSYLLIEHGRTLCKAHKPQCADCPLQSICPVSRINT